MEIVLNIAKNPQLSQKLNNKLFYYFLLESKERLTNEIKERTPQDTGKLWRSWTPRLEGNTKLTVSNSANYAAYVETGTGLFGENPHTIFPQTANAMHAVINGEDVFFKSSQGMKGYHMAEEGFKEYKRQIPMIWERAFNRATQGGK